MPQGRASHRWHRRLRRHRVPLQRTLPRPRPRPLTTWPRRAPAAQRHQRHRWHPHTKQTKAVVIQPPTVPACRDSRWLEGSCCRTKRCILPSPETAAQNPTPARGALSLTMVRLPYSVVGGLANAGEVCPSPSQSRTRGAVLAERCSAQPRQRQCAGAARPSRRRGMQPGRGPAQFQHSGGAGTSMWIAPPVRFPLLLHAAAAARSVTVRSI